MDFLLYSHHYGYNVDAVIAAPKVSIESPKHKYKTSVNMNRGVLDTKDICEKLSIPHYVTPHDSEDCLDILTMWKPEIGLIAGARILSRKVIELFSKGIINFHPGPIPEARGLDTPQWIIFDNLPLAVTSHFIDPRVDGGWIIKRLDMEKKASDTLQDYGTNLYLGQLEIFNETLQLALDKDIEEFQFVPSNTKPSYKYFPSSLEEELQRRYLELIKISEWI